ncbi:hypothetical protein [Agarivorans sp. JK6]|uniref:hypothetical protein n=1 Tax=Agarivorans sp. JK6 TaxID=2997426 RepID=UPI00387307B7
MHSTEQIPGYQATFDRSNKDRIPNKPTQKNSCSDKPTLEQRWWELVCARKAKLEPQKPNSLTALFEANRDSFFVIAGSIPYLRAVKYELLRATQHLRVPQEQLLIVTSKVDSTMAATFAPYLIRAERKMSQHWLDGGDTTLNIRLAGHALLELRQALSASVVKEKITTYTRGLPEMVQSPKRKRNSIEEVDNYLKNLLSSDSEISATRALRRFRDEGNAFEEKHFVAGLYRYTLT